MQGIYVEPEEVVAAIGKQADLVVRIRNQTAEALEDVHLFLWGNGYWDDAMAVAGHLEAYTETTVCLTLVPVKYASVYELTEKFQLTLKRADAPPKQLSFSHLFSSFNGSLDALIPKGAKLNILVAGPPGAGKSSMINTFITALSGERHILSPCVVGGAGAHVTRNLTRFDLPNLPIGLYDMWGLTESIHIGNDLRCLVQGQLPEGWLMRDPFSRAEANSALSSTASFRRHHAVLFFLPCASLNDPTECDHLRRLFLRLNQLKLRPILLLARADLEEPAVRASPFAKHPQIDRAKFLADDLLGIAPRYFYPAVPYMTEAGRVFDIDRLAFLILREAVVEAARFWELLEEEVKE